MDYGTIHYFWFGGGEKPALTRRCIESWHRFLPGFEIREWNESNFDVNCCLYVRQAYGRKKYAFVSDYARFYILEKYGGLYLDTDVELIRPLDELLEENAFAGYENHEYINPGQILWAKEAHLPILAETVRYYNQTQFLNEKGEILPHTVCTVFTGILKQHGFIPDGRLKRCAGMTLYPADYFNPFNDLTGVLTKTENTRSIHWYGKSWMPKHLILRNRITRVLHRYFGVDVKERILGKAGNKR